MMLLVLNRDGRGEVFKVGVVSSREDVYYISCISLVNENFFLFLTIAVSIIFV